MKKEIDEFAYKYDAYIRPSSRMHRRVRRVDYTAFNEEGPAIWDRTPVEDVKCVEIHMPEDRFRALIEHDEWLEECRRVPGWAGSKAEHIVNEHDRECRVRAQFPAVQMAWEKYQMMLKLCDEGSN